MTKNKTTDYVTKATVADPGFAKGGTMASASLYGSLGAEPPAGYRGPLVGGRPP